jgi:beta-lactamase class C
MLVRFLTISISFYLIFANNYCSNANELNHLNKLLAVDFAKELKKYNIPGGAYAIVKNNKIIALEKFGYTDKKKVKKVDGNTVFRLASV